MERSRQVDGFHVVAGALGVLVGLALSLGGAGTACSLLLVGLGALLLCIECMIVKQIEFEIAGFGHVVRAVIAVACVWSAALYLSRGADDLPSFLPGHDGDSGDLLRVRGVLVLVSGVALLVHVVALARPTRASD